MKLEILAKPASPLNQLVPKQLIEIFYCIDPQPDSLCDRKGVYITAQQEQKHKQSKAMQATRCFSIWICVHPFWNQKPLRVANWISANGRKD